MRKAIFAAMLLSLCLAAPAFAQCETLTILTESLPTFTPNEPANEQIEAIGGDGPYHFSIFDGAFPDGLHMNSHGKITGKPTDELADTTVFVTVTDSQGCTLTHAYAVRVGDI